MTRRYDRRIASAAIAGVLLSTYALHVELSAHAQPGRRALCDLGPAASCSRVLTSKFSKGFGIAPEGSALALPNSVFGTLFYCLMIFMATYHTPQIVKLQLLLAVTSVFSSVYFAYLLAFVLHDFCLHVSRAIYLVSKEQIMVTTPPDVK